MPLEGRGRRYSRARGAVEWALAHAYGRGWPAGLAHAVRMCGRLQVVRHTVVAQTGIDRPLRIGFVSDLHAGPTTHPSLLEAAAAALHEERPDVLLLGGDFVFLSARYADRAAALVRDVRAPLGKWAVLGNHDLWADDRHITRALEAAGVRVLVNETARLPAPFDRVAVCGVDDPWTGSRDGRRAFEGAKADDFRILLAHAPAALLNIGDERFDLGMCGHTHGGHIALPGGIPIVVPGPLSRRYPHGRFSLSGGRTLIVSRGVGATESPFRWNADPDVRIIDVVAHV
ncbi:MAG: metallophosphoesterase family protein [Deltaproteobacteria bacterium]|nr:metallophosphoesterase family protein [Deltaproteobacteria bacterium]